MHGDPLDELVWEGEEGYARSSSRGRVFHDDESSRLRMRCSWICIVFVERSQEAQARKEPGGPHVGRTDDGGAWSEDHSSQDRNIAEADCSPLIIPSKRRLGVRTGSRNSDGTTTS